MIDAETIFRKGCKCEAAPNRGVKQTEKSGSHRVFGRFSALKQKMSGKTGWFCYAKKSGCDILYQKMKSKNVSLAVEIYPREGTEAPLAESGSACKLLKFIPVRGQRRDQQGWQTISSVTIPPARGLKRVT